MGSDNICLNFQDDNILFVHTLNKDEYLDYTYDEDTKTFNIQYLGKVKFFKEDDKLKANFDNLMIEDSTKNVVFNSCEPW